MYFATKLWSNVASEFLAMTYKLIQYSNHMVIETARAMISKQLTQQALNWDAQGW